jgi:pyruvate/oxaloacetate carboxyltransferase
LHQNDAYDLVKKLKATVDIPIQLHAHATTGLSTASIVKAVEAGIDRVDTAHVFNGFCHIHPSLQGVHWADGVRNGALGVLA